MNNNFNEKEKSQKQDKVSKIFETRMEVRDYECDIEGIVNNANYLHYLEHTRHLFLKQCGLSFAEMHRKGVDAVVARMALQYKVPLRCDDEFVSRLSITREGVRYVFNQDIIRASDNKLSLRAKVELVCLIDGKLGRSAEYDAAFNDYFEE
ncbi:acyl-CoA thioesterase [Prevotella koreensis]|nr:thioesterase family protein [Prevotella koreensis]